MSPRRYRADRRRAAMDETRRRIVEATVELHAKQGVRATSYVMIAKRADVAVPTVYNHFPTLSELQAACSGHVMAQLPPLGPQIFEGAMDLEARLRALVRALFAFYRHCAPWMRWTFYESRFVPEIAPRYKKAAEQRRDLIALALAPAFGPYPPEALVALCEVLLDFPAWQRLEGECGLAAAEAEAAMSRALLALAQTQDAATRAAAQDMNQMDRRQT